MNLSQLVTQVKENVGRDDKEDDIPTYINLALERIQGDFPHFPEWEETSYIEIDPSDEDIDPRRVPLPDGITSIVQVRIANGRAVPLKRISRGDYDEKFPEAITDDARNGEPLYYTRWNKYLEVYPVPTSTYTYYLRWVKEHANLSEDDDEPYIKADNVIIECATLIMYNRLGLTEEARSQYEVYQTYLQSAVSKIHTLDNDKNLRLKGYRPRGKEFVKSTSRDQIWKRGDM